MRGRALTTSSICILALAASALPAAAATGRTTTRQAVPSNTCTTPPTTSPTAPPVPPVPATAPASPSGGTPIASGATPIAMSAASGGAAYGIDPDQTPVMPAACILDGKAYPPAEAPLEVQQAIWAANEIVGKPYKYGGGHARLHDSGYDCSGTVSYALVNGDLLDSPLDSSSFMHWGERGPGSWVTVYTNPGHAFVVIAGLRLDTSAAGDPAGNSGPQWRPVLRSTAGFRARHPVGF